MPAIDPKFRDVEDLEKAKFDLNDQDEVIVRTSVEGTLTPSGLNQSIKITTMNVSDTAVGLPVTPLVNRNSMIVHNKSATITLYIGASNVTADSVVGITSGYEIPPNSFLNFDITDDIVLYGIVPSGQTIMVKIMELA